MTTLFIHLLAVTAVAAQIPAPPAPPIAAAPTVAPMQVQLIRWTMGEARCGGAPVAAVHRVTPMVAQTYGRPTMSTPDIAVRFRVDPTGRPLGITVDASGYRPESGDIAPSLAASRFAPGERQDCSIVYTAVRSPIGEAAIDDVRAFTVTPNVRPSRDMFRATYPAGSDCFDPGPAVRLRAFPPFDTLPQEPGQIGWSMTQFDVDAAGRPVNLRTVAGTGSASLDAASRTAVADTRFAPGVRHGCVYPYYINPAILAAPPVPEQAGFRRTDASCAVGSPWATEPQLRFPTGYERRRIEGWAIIGFDVAPWGATGNVKILAAEPTSDFGEVAQRIVRNATKVATATGYTGCVERVIFRAARPGDPKDTDGPRPQVMIPTPISG